MDIKIMKIKNGPFDFELDSTIIDGDLMFIASRAAKVLGYSNTRDAIISNVWEENKRRIHIDNMECIEGVGANYGGNSGVIKKINSDYVFINEPGLYQLIFGSKLEKAKEFQRWVFNEVLPSIRKNNGYFDRYNINTVDELEVAKNNATIEWLNSKNRDLETENEYLKEENSKAQEEMDNLNARNGYLEDRCDKLVESESRLKKIVKYFLDRDKNEFMVRNDITATPRDTIGYNKFLKDIVFRLVSKDPIYKEVRVPDYYEKEEDFYA